MNKDYKIIKTRLKGNKLAIVCTGDGTGYATNAELLARNFGPYSGRYKGYIVSQKRGKLFESMFMRGWRGAMLGGLYPPKTDELSTSHIATIGMAEHYHKTRVLKNEVGKGT